MKKHLLPYVIALCLLLLNEGIVHIPVVRNMVESNEKNYVQLKLSEIRLDNPKKMDVIALGSSRTSDGFATKAFEGGFINGLNAYNYGVPGLCDYYVFVPILKQHIQEYGKPKLVLLEVSESFLRKGYFCQSAIQYFDTISSLDPKVRDDINSSDLFTMDGKFKIFLSSISGIFRYKGVLDPRGVAKIMLGKKSHNITLEQGWEPQPLKSDLEVKEGIHKRFKYAIGSFGETSTSQLEYILSFCQHEGIHVVLVNWPSHPLYSELLSQSRFNKSFKRDIQRVSKNFNVPLIDLSQNSTLFIRQGLFSDGSHLSEEGARLYSSLLAKQVEKAESFHPIVLNKN